MSLDDDIWSFARLALVPKRDQEYGVGSCRVRDAHGLVHRLVWERSASGWRTLCGFPFDTTTNNVTTRLEGDEILTCLHCIGEGG